MKRHRRGTKWNREPGLIREKLTKVLLRDLGVMVNPYDLWCQEGFYKLNYHDLARWGCYYAKDKEGRDIQISSWDTMTNCARYGVDWFDAGGYWEICQKPKAVVE